MLTSQNLRMTPQRKVILEELRKVTSHPTADELYERVRKRLPKISLGTVYRNLDILSSAGIIKKLHLEESQMRFDGNTEPHNHIYCLSCGRVADVVSSLDRSSLIQNIETDFTVLGVNLILSGICPQCQKKDNHNKIPQWGKGIL